MGPSSSLKRRKISALAKPLPGQPGRINTHASGILLIAKVAGAVLQLRQHLAVVWIEDRQLVLGADIADLCYHDQPWRFALGGFIGNLQELHRIVSHGVDYMTTCTIEGCGRRVSSRGLCGTHYWRQKRGTPALEGPIRVYGAPHCVVPGCQRPHLASGYCSAHSQRVRKTGTADGLPLDSPRPCRLCGRLFVHGKGARECSPGCRAVEEILYRARRHHAGGKPPWRWAIERDRKAAVRIHRSLWWRGYERVHSAQRLKVPGRYMAELRGDTYLIRWTPRAEETEEAA